MRLLLVLIIIYIGSINCIKVKELLNQYSTYKLETNIDHLSENDKLMLSYLFKAADIMDDVFWFEEFGRYHRTFLKGLTQDQRDYATINYGPWDKFDDQPFIKGYGVKPPGANFYPHDITDVEYANFNHPNKDSWYTILNRSNQTGELTVQFYHDAWPLHIENTARLLEHASKYSTNESFKKYLKLRATALRTDNYYESDIQWMSLENNTVDLVIGPIESYADGFKGTKAAHSAQILIKDLEWSKRIEKYNVMLPELQANLPVENKYKEDQTSKGDMFVYYLIYCRGDYNWGPKNIAINLPNDPNVQKVKGTRKLQLKNAMRAKFERILIPMANLLIDDSQIQHVVFDNGFFQNTMFHEIAHGLGVKFVVDDKTKSVRKALEENYSALEEAKADITGIFFIQYLIKNGELDIDIMDCYVSYLAGILRSVRFGASSAHGSANMISYNFIYEKGGFSRNNETSKYTINKEQMDISVSQLVNKIITIQGDGNKQVSTEFIKQYGYMKKELKDDLDKVAKEGIPRDIVFDQSIEYFGINPVKF